MDSKLKEFYDSCYSDYKNNYYPKFLEEMSNLDSKYSKEDPTIGAIKTLLEKIYSSISFNNDLAINYISKYHEWLIHNYNITPKE